MVKKMIPVGKPVFDAEMKQAALDAMDNEKFVLGESVFKFEEEFAKYCGVKYAVSTSSGTNALQIALIAAGAKPGSEVITTASSFIATSNSIVHANCTPKFADVGSDNNLAVEQIPSLLSPKTKAIMPVHLYGLPARMDEVNEIAQKNNLTVIEDACQAHGSIYKAKKAGALGKIGCFSFYTTKNMMVAGDGGMITTDDEAIAKLSAKLRNCGRTTQYEHDEIGFTSRLNTISAAVGRVQLKRLDGWNAQRRVSAAEYKNRLAGVTQIRTPMEPQYAQGNYHLYSCKAEKRDALVKFLSGKGVQCATNYPIPIPYQPIYRKLYGFKGNEFPASQQLSNEVVCLPMFAGLTTQEIATVCDAVKEFYSNE